MLITWVSVFALCSNDSGIYLFSCNCKPYTQFVLLNHFPPIITVHYLICIQSSTYMHQSSATYLPILQYNISSAFSRQHIRTSHLLHTYQYCSTTSHPHSVVSLYAPLICYLLTIITVQHLICIQSSTYTHHSSATYLTLLQYISSAFSRQLVRTTHLLPTFHYYSTTSHLHSVVKLHASLICYLLTIITVQHLICIQSSTYTHHSSTTYLPLLQYISSAFSRQLVRTTHLLHTYHYYSTTSHPHSVVNIYAPVICYILTNIAVQHLIRIQSSAYTHHSSATYLPLLQYNISSAFSRQLIRTTHLLHT